MSVDVGASSEWYLLWMVDLELSLLDARSNAAATNVDVTEALLHLHVAIHG